MSVNGIHAESLEETFKYVDPAMSVETNDWASGRNEATEFDELVMQPGTNAQNVELRFSDTWYKAFDEGIVNITDHLLRCLQCTIKVTAAAIDYTVDGAIIMYNNGPGVPVVIHSEATTILGKEIYIPELIFGHVFQGSSFNAGRKADETGKIIGGRNGLGIKIANIASTWFELETVDAERQLHYKQRWTNGMKQVGVPVIRKATVAQIKQPFTRISFMPNHSVSGMTNDNNDGLRALLRTRVMYMAAYVALASSYKMKITYCGEQIPQFKSVKELAACMFPESIVVAGNMTPTLTTASGKESKSEYTYTWQVAAVLVPTKPLKLKQISIINGIVVKSGGHLARVRADINAQVKALVTKNISAEDVDKADRHIGDNLFIILVGQMPNPPWDGQRKESIKLKADKFKHYNVDPAVARGIAKIAAADIQALVQKTAVAKTTIAKVAVDFDKYYPPRRYGRMSKLLAYEGDSAMANGKTGIPSNEFIGLMSLGGVIMNARKQSEVSDIDGKQYVKRSKRFEANATLNALINIVGLNISFKYDPKSSTYKKEMASLRFGCIIACVDQDLDGKGNILGLLMNVFATLWPNLFVAGFIKWMSTPIVRLFPKRGGRVIEFHSVVDYHEYAANHNIKGYNARYYKGLGGHDPADSKRIYANMEDNLYTFIWDVAAADTFEIYYGNATDKRKDILAKPTRVITTSEYEKIRAKKIIPCSLHLHTEINTYQKDNIERKLDHAIDGHNQSGRKITWCIIKGLSATEPKKTAQLAGFIADTGNYEHGEQSLGSSLTYRGFIAPGGRQMPYIRPYGMFGTRLAGGDDAAAARYTHVTLNAVITDLVFPHVDNQLLEYTTYDGKRAEPKYYIPIVPMAILESSSLPGTGWKIETWARELDHVINVLMNVIIIDDAAQLPAFRPYTYANCKIPWTGTLQYTETGLRSFGKYTLDRAANCLTITELPLRIWTSKYLKSLLKIAAADASVISAEENSINSDSNDVRVCITVQLVPGAIENVLGNSHAKIISYFKLSSPMTSHINLMNIDGGVTEYSSYEDVFRDWYPLRRDLYIARVERQRIIRELEIEYYANIIRYIIDADKLRMAKRQIAAMIEKLAAEGYQKFNRAGLKKQKYTPNNRLHAFILEESADYDYLIGLSDRDKSAESLAKYQAEHAKLCAELAEFTEECAKGRFPGASIWLKELEALKTIAAEGAATGWTFGDDTKYTYL